MKTKNFAILFSMLILVSLISFFIVSAEVKSEENDPKVLGMDMDEIIVIGSSILALFLFAVTFAAYMRDGRKRLLYVAIAFFLFAIKGVLISLDTFFPEKGMWADPIANFLDFAILLSFFFGVVRKRG